MKQHPILFSTPMVQAILADYKTMTRRIMKHQPEIDKQTGDIVYRIFKNETVVPIEEFKELRKYNCPYGKPGDILWVRETFAFTIGKYEPYDTYSYKADSFHRDINREGIKYTDLCKEGWHDPDLAKELKWRSSIHMPKSACRIWLEITNIRVERLQDITINQSFSEGIERVAGGGFKDYSGILFSIASPRLSFQSLWESINGPNSWDANPWIWVIEFKRIEKPSTPMGCPQTDHQGK